MDGVQDISETSTVIITITRRYLRSLFVEYCRERERDNKFYFALDVYVAFVLRNIQINYRGISKHEFCFNFSVCQQFRLLSRNSLAWHVWITSNVLHVHCVNARNRTELIIIYEKKNTFKRFLVFYRLSYRLTN